MRQESVGVRVYNRDARASLTCPLPEIVGKVSLQRDCTLSRPQLELDTFLEVFLFICLLAINRFRST